MGADQSTSNLIIEPQSTPICAIEPRFCIPHNVRLHFSCPIPAGDFVLTDANNRNIVYFRCNGHNFNWLKLDSARHKFLRDYSDVIVINMKRKVLPSSIRYTDEFNIFAGNTRERHICKLVAHYACFKLNMSVEFSDIIDKEITRQLILKSDRSTDLKIYLGHPKQGGVLVARMFPVTAQMCLGLGTGVEFYIEIAANVDIALMAMLCIAAVHASAEYEIVTRSF